MGEPVNIWASTCLGKCECVLMCACVCESICQCVSECVFLSVHCVINLARLPLHVESRRIL